MQIQTSFVALAGLLAVTVAAPLAAQRTTATARPAAGSAHGLQWGPQISYNFSSDDLGVGARLEHSLAGLLGTSRVDGIGEANWFPGTVDVFDLTYNVVYRFQTPSLQPYAGGGLSLWVASGGGNSAANLHLNAVGGLKFRPLGRVTPMVQLRYVFVQGDALIATAGILF